MKRLLSIFFLSIYLFSATVFSELLKVPILLEHYKEHKSQNSSLGFLNYLYQHYASNFIIDKDFQKDAKLPFKGDFNNNLQPISCNDIFYIDIKQQSITALQKIRISAVDESFISSYYGGIWQPPKIS